MEDKVYERPLPYNMNGEFNLHDLLDWFESHGIIFDNIEDIYLNKYTKFALRHLVNWTDNPKRTSKSTRGYVLDCVRVAVKVPDDGKLDKRRANRIYQTLENIRRPRRSRGLPT